MPRGKKGPIPEMKVTEESGITVIEESFLPEDPTAEEIVGQENIVDIDDPGPVPDELPAGYKCADCTFTSDFLSEIEEHCNGTQHGGFGNAYADLKKELEQAKAEIEVCKPWTPKLLKQYVEDTSDGFECLPKCDSHGHEELCPVTNVVQAFRLLRERLEQAKERERQLQKQVANEAQGRDDLAIAYDELRWKKLPDLESANATLIEELRQCKESRNV